MPTVPIKRPQDCEILVVDDDYAVSAVIRDTLLRVYPNVHVCHTAEEAFAEIEKREYDIVITDLKLPDVSGIEVLRAAKNKDAYTEVIVITGYASVDSASEAINSGVSSYLMKPLSLDDFMIQVERAAAARAFHCKSLIFMNHAEGIDPRIKGHLHDITALYYFSRKLMLALEASEVMRIILEEANNRLQSLFCAIGVHFLGYSEAYAMPRFGGISESAIEAASAKAWDASLTPQGIECFSRDKLTIFKGKQGLAPAGKMTDPVIYPMTVLGRPIGFFALVNRAGNELNAEKSQFLHVFVSLISSIIEHAYMDMQAKKQAKTDGLTGVANHRMFHETIEREMARADRNLHSFCLALIDIDDFKKINDTYGHLVGDAVLVDLTKRISSKIRRGDVLARYGGEEFALILPETGIGGARALAERVCQEIADEPLAFSKMKVRYTISVGLAEYDGKKARPKDALIHEADQALYASKRAGKNRVSVKK